MVLNTTAVDLDLGTGGWHFVHWNLERGEWVEPGPGHIMKLRYTSLQADVGSTEEHLDPDLAARTDAAGLPVVATPLHSQLPAVVIGTRHARPDARIAYVMTDGAALPLALSDLVAGLRDRDLLDTTITCGHAFGGDHEAVNVYSALMIARHVVGADVAIVAMGPGIVGTGTALGFTGIEVGSVLDATVGLGGVPVACLRVSAADPRGRHQGISHHTLTTLTVGTRSRATVPVPAIGGVRRGRPPRRSRAIGHRGRPRRRPRHDPGRARALRRARPARHVDGAARGRGPDALPVCGRSRGRRGRSRNLVDLMADAAAKGEEQRADGPDRRERLLNLLAALIETRAGLTREDLVTNPTLGYSANPASARRAFERDKATLRAMGVPIRDIGDDAETRYRVDPSEYYLPDLGLTDDELAALHVAVTAIGLGSNAGEGALMKLGGIEGAGAAPIAELPFVDVLAPLFEASRRRAVVHFSYRGRLRELEPWGLTSKFGHWYVVGFDRGADDMRVFRADRIDDDIETDAAGAFSVPADFRADAYLEDRPWDYGEGRRHRRRGRGRRRLRGRLLPGGRSAGARWKRAPTASSGSRSAPSRSGRSSTSCSGSSTTCRSSGHRRRATRSSRHSTSGRSREREDRRMSRTDAPPQLERVLAMIPWLATHRDVPKTEIADRFRISVDELEADLALIMMVGVPPYSPGDYINVTYDGDTVDLWLAPYFTAPLQLTAPEGLALLAGGRTLLAVPGSDPEGPLATAISKLERALGVTEVTVELASPPFLDAVRAAAAEGRRIEIEYWSSGRDALTTRRIDPGPPFFALGEWYTDAYCWLREGAAHVPHRPHAVGDPDRRDVPPGATDRGRNRLPPPARGSPGHARAPSGCELGHGERAGRVGRGAGRRSAADRRAGQRARLARSGSCCRSDPTPWWSTHRSGATSVGPRPARVRARYA